jgi:hypothetical protein
MRVLRTGLKLATVRPKPVVVASSDEPVYNAGSNTLVWSNDMDAYTDATAMGATPIGSAPRILPLPSPAADSNPVDASRNQIITPGRGGGGKCIRLLFTGVSQSSSTYLTINTTDPPTNALNHFQWWGRINIPNLVNTLAVKWFQAWHASVGRMQFNLHDAAPGAPFGGHQNYWQVYDNSVLTTSQGDQPVGPFLEDVNDNLWHRFIYQYRCNSGVGARDGVARAWIDGTKIIDISNATIGVTPPGGGKVWCNADDVDAFRVNDGITSVRWGEPQTTDSDPWTLDIDDFKWWY